MSGRKAPPPDFPPPERRRWPLLALILALHAGFFLVLQNGLLQRALTSAAPAVVTATIFPPATPTATAKPRPPRPAQPPERPRLVRKPVPPKREAPQPATPPRPATQPPTAADAQPTVQPAIQEAAPSAPPAASPATTLPPAPAPAPAGPKTITSGVQYLEPPQPDYPPQSKRLGEEGRVVLRVLVDEAGRPGQVTVQKASGFPRLDEAAVDAVRRARFKPHVEDGRPLAVYVMVPISFRLEQ